MSQNRVSLCRFKFIPQEDQLELLSIHSSPICQIIEDGIAYTLFWLDGFFAEIIQESAGAFEVIGVHAYKSSKSLDKFTERLTWFDLI